MFRDSSRLYPGGFIMEKLIGILPPLTYLVFLLAERTFPGRPLPPVRGWRIKGLVFFAIGGALVGTLPRLWAGWARAHRLIDLEWLGTVGGALIAIVLTDFLGYWGHRLRHRLTPLWRLHQMHHSAERMDVAGAFYFHPLDTVFFALVTTLVARVVFGVNGPAAALAGSFGFFVAVFTHANLRTPRWLGFVLQRPEAHAVHHERGVHAFNYGGLALWDLVFGTYRNPQLAPAETGFWDGASGRLGALLTGADMTNTESAHHELAA
jgi:sterol desaturase/sphingolipid hydroxylase (fatty acid hydroxylase superfamily)